MQVAMVEAAWRAVEHRLYWKSQFERLSVRIGLERSMLYYYNGRSNPWISSEPIIKSAEVL
jgi:hypothetical protein